MVKNLPANAGEAGELVQSMVWEDLPWGRKWQPTSVLLAEKSHGQRSLAGHSPWGCKESDMSTHKQRKCLKVYNQNIVLQYLWGMGLGKSQQTITHVSNPALYLFL